MTAILNIHSGIIEYTIPYFLKMKIVLESGFFSSHCIVKMQLNDEKYAETIEYSDSIKNSILSTLVDEYLNKSFYGNHTIEGSLENNVTNFMINTFVSNDRQKYLEIVNDHYQTLKG